MSDREKQLLSILAIAGFIIANVFLFSLFSQKSSLATTQLDAAKANLQQAIALQESSSQLAEQMDWLAKTEPEPNNYQTVQTELQQFADAQAKNLGLTVKSEFLPTDQSGVHYHRAQVKITLTGREQAIYSWFSAINDPAAFRAAYQIRISPNADDTLIDCSATLSQWFPPAPQ